MSGPGGLDLGFLDEGEALRRRRARRRGRLAIGVSASVTLIWLTYVTASGQWGRVGDNVAAGITMIFGSFVAGSTPQGGGAVAFPVFTKALEIPAEVARTFSLSIQAVGMGAAAATMVITRRRIEWRAVSWGLPVAAVCFLLAAFLLGESSDPFLRPIVPGPYVKVSFTLIVGAMALITYLGTRTRIRKVNVGLPRMNRRTYSTLVVIAALGGLAAALTGSGADVFIYLYLAVLLGVDPRVGVPTSVMVMAGVSVIGFVALGLGDGQLAVTVVGDQVTDVGGTAVSLEAARYDLFGLWLAAVPVVAWGAPLGAWVAGRMEPRHLVILVVALASVEIVTTGIFVTELHTNPALLAFALVGALVIGGGLLLIWRNARRFFDLDPLHLGRGLGRKDLDVAAGYRDELGVDAEDGEDA